MVQTIKARWILMGLLLALLVGILPATVGAADQLDDHEEAAVTTAAPVSDDDLFYMVVLQSAVDDIEALYSDLDKLHRGDKSACPSINNAVFWGLIFPEVPMSFDFFDIGDVAVEGSFLLVDALTDSYYVCFNGTGSSISDFEHGYAYSQLARAQEKFVAANQAARDRTGLIAPGDQVLLEQIVGLFTPEGGPFSAQVMHDDIQISALNMQFMAGWLDRAVAGDRVRCGEFYDYWFALRPADFDSIPFEYQGLYNEYVAAVDQVQDTSRAIIEFCDATLTSESVTLSEFNVNNARHGLELGIARIQRVLAQMSAQ